MVSMSWHFFLIVEVSTHLWPQYKGNASRSPPARGCGSILVVMGVVWLSSHVMWSLCICTRSCSHSHSMQINAIKIITPDYWTWSTTAPSTYITPLQQHTSITPSHTVTTPSRHHIQVGGRSLYGLIQKFLRVLCRYTREVTDLALVKWFAPPTYPDGDQLLVKINLDLPPPEGCERFLFLDEIDPTPAMYELVHDRREMYVMRIRGLDVVPDL